MGLFEHFPYTNFHDLNLNWIIGKIKNVETAEANTAASAEAAAASAEASQLSAEAAQASAENAAASEESAEQSKQDAAQIVLDTTNQISVLQSRVDNIIPEGTQTEGNTELIDIRVAADGHTYDSAGNAVRGQINGVYDTFDSYFEPGNNLLILKNYEETFHGITAKIQDGIISLTGTSESAIRMKISGDTYKMRSTASPDWTQETLPQFEIGKTYSLHTIPVRGNVPTSIGASLRNSNADSIISVPNPQATLEIVPSFAMLYIPNNTTLDCSFIPLFIEGTTEDEAVFRHLLSVVKVDGIKTYETPDMSADFIYDSVYQSAMKFPESYKPAGDPTPLLILSHGLSSTLSASYWGGQYMLPLVNRFVSEGYAVLDVNHVTNQDWCNPALYRKYIAAINAAVSKYNVIPTVIYAESMGGLIGLTLSNILPGIRCIVVSGLRLDMAARYALLTNENKEIVDRNLGFTDGYDADIAAGWNPTAFNYESSGGQLVNAESFPPAFFIYATDDDLIKTESLEKVTEIKRAGTITQAQEYEGDHTDVCYLLAGTSFDDAMAWFDTWTK